MVSLGDQHSTFPFRAIPCPRARPKSQTAPHTTPTSTRSITRNRSSGRCPANISVAPFTTYISRKRALCTQWYNAHMPLALRGPTPCALAVGCSRGCHYQRETPLGWPGGADPEGAPPLRVRCRRKVGIPHSGHCPRSGRVPPRPAPGATDAKPSPRARARSSQPERTPC